MPQHGWTLRTFTLSEVSQRRTNTIRYHFHVGSKNTECRETKTSVAATKGLGWGKRNQAVGQREQTSGSQTNKFWESNEQKSDYSQYRIILLKVAKHSV